MDKIPYFFKTKRTLNHLFNENTNFNNNISKASSLTSACDLTRLDEIKKYSNISSAPSSFWPSSRNSFLGKTKSFLDGTKNRVSFCFSSKKTESKTESKLRKKIKKSSQHSFLSKLFRNLGLSSKKMNRDPSNEQFSELVEKLQTTLDLLNSSENVELLKCLSEKLSKESSQCETIKAEFERFKSELGPLFKTALKEYFHLSPVIEKKTPFKSMTTQAAFSDEYSKEENKFTAQTISSKISEKIKKFDVLIKQNQANMSKPIQLSSTTNSRQNKLKDAIELVELKRNLNEMFEKKQLSVSIDENGKLLNKARPSRLLTTKDSLIVHKNIQPKDSLSSLHLNELQDNSSFSSSSLNSKSKVIKSKSSNDLGLKKVSFDLDKKSLDTINKNIFLNSKEFECICKSKYLNSDNFDTFLDFLMAKLAKIREVNSIPSDIELMSKRDMEIEKPCLESVLNQLESIAENIECLTSNENYLELKKRSSLLKFFSRKI